VSKQLSRKHNPHQVKNMNVHKDILTLYENSGKPFRSREETQQIITTLMGKMVVHEDEDDTNSNKDSIRLQPLTRPPLSNVYGSGPLLLSDIPDSCKKSKSATSSVVLGIDEAGRGSVLGPMTYGMAFWNPNKIDPSNIKDFNDSKQLTHETRCRLLDDVILPTADIGFGLRVIHANEISRNMLRPQPYNLNQMSHDTAMDLIQAVLDTGDVTIEACYIDTVGIAENYQRKLEARFPTIRFTVESKADFNYPPCAAASIVAKVVRDRMMDHWQYSETTIRASGLTNDKEDCPMGSGYPSDPVTKAWMDQNLSCPIFGFPDLVRFSWNPTKKALDPTSKEGEKPVVQITFEADLDEDEEHGEYSLSVKRQRDQMTTFLGKTTKRYPYFQRNKLQRVTKIA
jgi:ribonuclease H2 subunit A